VHPDLDDITEPAHHDTSPSDTSRREITTLAARAPHEQPTHPTDDWTER
jgi:hypothetical protein